jgi:microcystin-dependent protein
MAEPFLSEIRIMSFSYAPKGWAKCDGQLLPINQQQGLFSLLGTVFGGNGQTTFGLPDLRDRVPMHVGNKHSLGEAAGEQAHTLNKNEMAMHTHSWRGTTNDANSAVPTNNLFGAVSNVYTGANNTTPIEPTTVGMTGGSQAHNNMQPFLTLNFCIALLGIFPSPN